MKNIEQMILYSGTKDIFILKIEADPSSELATMLVQEFITWLDSILDGVASSWGQWFLCAPIWMEMQY